MNNKITGNISFELILTINSPSNDSTGSKSAPVITNEYGAPPLDGSTRPLPIKWSVGRRSNFTICRWKGEIRMERMVLWIIYYWSWRVDHDNVGGNQVDAMSDRLADGISDTRYVLSIGLCIQKQQWHYYNFPESESMNNSRIPFKVVCISSKGLSHFN